MEEIKKIEEIIWKHTNLMLGACNANEAAKEITLLMLEEKVKTLKVIESMAHCGLTMLYCLEQIDVINHEIDKLK